MDGAAPLGSIFRTYPTFNLYNNNNRSYVARANSNFVIRGFLTVPTIRPDIHFEQKVEIDPPREGIWGRETSEEKDSRRRIRGFFPFLFFFSWSPTQVRIIYATTSIKVGEGDGQGEIADTRICKTGWREGGGAAMAYTRPTICTVISMRRNSMWLAVTRCISVVARPICTR